MMQATSVQPPKTVRIIPATIDTKAAITQSYRQLRVAAYCRVSSTVSISGSSSKEFYLDFLIHFFATFRPEGFILCFAAQFLSRLHGHVRPLLLMVGWLVPQGHALLLQLFQPLAVDLDSAGAGLWGRSCPGRSGSCDGAAGSLPALQRADGFSPSGSEGTVHTDCLARWIGSANMRLSPRRGEPPYQQDIACPAYTVNYLFRLLRVSIKRDRAPGSTVRDGRTFPADCRMAESVHALIDTLSKAMWIRRRGYRAVPNQGQPHPG